MAVTEMTSISTPTSKAQEHVLHAGDTFETPAYAPHIVKNGSAETELTSTYIAETGKPLTKALP